MAPYSRISSKADDGRGLLKLVLLAMLFGALSVSSIVSGILWARSHIQATRAAERAPACTASAQRLLTVDSLVGLEREKYLLTAMDCDVWRQVRDLRQ